MDDNKDCPDCGEPMEYIDDDPEFGALGWMCFNDECGRV